VADRVRVEVHAAPGVLASALRDVRRLAQEHPGSSPLAVVVESAGRPPAPGEVLMARGQGVLTLGEEVDAGSQELIGALRRFGDVVLRGAPGAPVAFWRFTR
jgi:hypothetical protein